MIEAPEPRGREMAKLYRELAPKLYEDLEASGLIPEGASSADRDRARREWECFALYACVRGLVAAGGFNRESAAAIDALHAAVFDEWEEAAHAGERIEARRQLISDRYAEYGEIGQAGGASGAASVADRLGHAAARHMLDADPGDEFGEMVGALHESLVEGSAEAVRRGASR